MNPGASADAGVSAPDAGVSADANAGIGTTTEKSPSSNVQFGHSDTSLAGSVRKRTPSAARASTRRPASTAATLQTSGVPAVPKAGQRPLFFA